MNQNNMNTNVGKTDPNTGAVYTSGTNLDQGPGVAAGAVYTSGTNPSGINTSNVNNVGLNTQSNSMSYSGTGNSGVANVQQIRQQIQNIQSQLRQSQTNGAVNQAYTDAANRLQDVFEILNNA